MKNNMGNLDRIVRAIAAIIFSALYFTGTITGTFATVLLLLGAMLLTTSFISFCPLYRLIGVHTSSRK